MARIEKTVFISYRRTNIPWALAIYQDLTNSGFDVFFDYTGIAAGDFESVVLENIRSRAHFLVLLTPSALERCADPADWLRREIETALDTKRNIVPLMLEGFDFGTPKISDQLTGKLEPLKRYNALNVPADYFLEAMGRLRDRHLNVALDAVQHPASASALQAATEQKVAAATALPVNEEELTAQQWFERGYHAVDTEEKTRFYSQAIRLKPDYARAFNNRGSARYKKGDLDAAIEDYNEALRLKLDDPEVFYNRGIARGARGDSDGAIEDCSAAIWLRPDYADAFNNRGIARYDQGDLDGAIKDYDEAIRLNPSDASAFNNRGMARGAKGDLAGAIKDYNEAVRLKPDYAAAFNNRGIARRADHDFDGAANDYKKAVRLQLGGGDTHKPFFAAELVDQIPRSDRHERSVSLTPPSRPLPSEGDRYGSRPLNEGKLILVGRGEVGKTSLVKRLVEDEFDEGEPKTQGIRITPWRFPCNGITVGLNVWDFGGQEIMHSTHQFFLTQQSLYLLVLSGRDDGEDIDAEYWLKHIETFGADSPVIVVQNKIAQHPFELDYRGLRARYGQIRDFVRTDCKDQIGLNELKNLIESVVAKMPEIRMPFPSDWFKVKHRLETMPEEYLGHQGFVELCAREGVDDQVERDALGIVMHNLGIALSYRDDPRLRETSVLKPEWVTHGIYAVLNAKSVADRQGELHLEDLQKILPKERYPLDKHVFLIELMRKFSLCFPFEDDAGRYLIPDLLGKEQPEEVATFEPKNCLNFEYCYGVLPEGLLARFIVRTHTLSRGVLKRWRSGVILSYEGAIALVRAEQVERRVLVSVKGGDAGARRSLLAIIRFDFDRIHREFKDRLDAQAKVPVTGFPARTVDYKKLVKFAQDGIKDFPELIDGNVVYLKVTDLLNGVDLEGQRPESDEDPNRGKSIFLSYSHRDEGLRDELETHLKLLQRRRVISLWHDRKILSGEEWDREIDSRIDDAAIILLLISADFLASDYCWDKEVTRALERHALKEAIVVPVILRSCDWTEAPFAKLQGLPKDMKAVTAWSDRDAAWTDVAKGIRKIAGRTAIPAW